VFTFTRGIYARSFSGEFTRRSPRSYTYICVRIYIYISSQASIYSYTNAFIYVRIIGLTRVHVIIVFRAWSRLKLLRLVYSSEPLVIHVHMCKYIYIYRVKLASYTNACIYGPIIGLTRVHVIFFWAWSRLRLHLSVCSSAPWVIDRCICFIFFFGVFICMYSNMYVCMYVSGLHPVVPLRVSSRLKLFPLAYSSELIYICIYLLMYICLYIFTYTPTHTSRYRVSLNLRRTHMYIYSYSGLLISLQSACLGSRHA